MYAIEFQARVKNGFIEVPREYLARLSRNVRVIVLVESDSEQKNNLIDELLAQPVRLQEFQPLTREEIYAR